MRIGVIDIGSNTVHLLVADSDGREMIPITDPSRALFLGQDVVATGSISPAKLGLAVTTVLEYVKKARELGAERVVAVATEAVRRATNGDAVVAVLRASDVEVAKVSATREGELAAVGASIDTKLSGSALITDIGGASTQLISAVDGVPRFVRSLPIGSGTVATRLTMDPPRASAIASVGGMVVPAIHTGLDAIFPDTPPIQVVGVGGTLRRISKIANKKQRTGETTRDNLESLVDEFFAVTVPVLAKKYELDPKRVGTLRVGGLVFLTILDRLGVKKFRISGYGIREGAALLMAKGRDFTAEGQF